MQVKQEAINTCPDPRLQEHLKCIRPNYLLQYVRTEQSTDTYPLMLNADGRAVG